MTIFAAYVMAGIYALLTFWRTVMKRSEPTPDQFTLLFMGFTVAYVMSISVLTEIGDNQRMRFMLDPLVMAICVAAISRRLRPPAPRSVSPDTFRSGTPATRPRTTTAP